MTVVMARPAVTAEWLCTRCGSTNRKLVPVSATEALDRCVSCHARHRIARGPRPVRWTASLAARSPGPATGSLASPREG